jgi:transcriptional regulator with XRE-family HTH domain
VLTSVGTVIRKRRKELNLTQEQLAELAKIDRSYLGQVERGENSIALLPLKKIAEALSTTVAELMLDAGI